MMGGSTTRWMAACLTLTACAPSALSTGLRYLDDDTFRRSALEASLVNPSNGYAQLRTENYGLVDREWDALDVFNPPVRALTEADVGRFIETPLRLSTEEEGELVPVFSERPETEAEWIALGARAFETYPVQLADVLGTASDQRATLDQYGLWVDGRGHVGGLVRVQTRDGGEHFAVTCATCHARPDDAGELIHGLTNHRFDWGALSYQRSLEAGTPHEEIAYFLGWGPGQVDVTTDAADNPTAITDLRGVRHHTHLHWAATVENDLVALAIRIETLLITSTGQAVRPPREIPLALALYLTRMSEQGEAGDANAEPEGAALYQTHCGACHGADGSVPTGRVSIGLVGTDPVVGNSPERTTGFYRVPSLLGIADRGQLLHDGDVDSLEQLLDPARLETIPGHAYGTTLDASQRAALIAFTRTIGASRR